MPTQPKSDTGINPSTTTTVEGSVHPYLDHHAAPNDGKTSLDPLAGCGPECNIFHGTGGGHGGYALGAGRPD